MLRVLDEDGGPLEDMPDAGVLGLLAGVPYVRGWADAEQAAELLRTELDAWGIGDRLSVRANVSAGGVGVVGLGWVTPEVARLLAGLLAYARQGPDDTAPRPTSEQGPAPRAA